MTGGSYMQSANKWATREEIGFLKGLGTHKERPNHRTRRELLIQYRELMKQRLYWGSVDRAIIEDYLAMEIGKEGVA